MRYVFSYRQLRGIPMNYRHTQIGYTTITALGAVICLIIAHIQFFGAAPLPIAVLIILVVCLLIFLSLTIEIRDGFLSWKLGFGLIHKNVPASDIIRATPIKITHFQGWGIHWTPGGWLYNVSGFQAVEFELKIGENLDWERMYRKNLCRLCPCLSTLKTNRQKLAMMSNIMAPRAAIFLYSPICYTKNFRRGNR